jgi:Fuc2NAc and GlcNAc transferase
LRGALLITAASGATSMLLTQAIRRIALTRGLLDMPNERSAHTTPTPRGGGGAIVLAATAGFVLLHTLHSLDAALLVALLGGGLAVAIVGLIDDRRPLPAALRLLVHFIAATWAIAWVGGLPALEIDGRVLIPGAVSTILAALGIVWVLNLFNFMDGIDGIAASEATFVALSGAMLTTAASVSVSGGVAAAAFVLGASCVGFLRWNWPPASIFMGDVGSGFLGYVIAVLALAAARQSPIALWVWLTLGGVFFIDATVTLLRRLLRGERIYEAHSSHAYQCLARRWGSHRRVTVAVAMVNVIWLLPCAFLATRHPDRAVAIVVVALVPLVALAIAAGSGRRENATLKDG